MYRIIQLVGTYFLFCTVVVQAFHSHLLHPVKIHHEQSQNVKLWEHLAGKDMAEACIGIFHDGISSEPQCFPSPSMPVVLRHYSQGEFPVEQEDDCEEPFYDISGDVLCWVS